MISHEKKIVFIHIPKTGGKRLADFLFPYCDEESLKFSPFREDGDLHATAIDYLEYYGEERLRDYTFFTIVRNPFDKVLSLAMHQNNNVFDRQKFRKIVENPRSQGLWPHSHCHFLLRPTAVQMLKEAGALPQDPDINLVVDFPGQSTLEGVQAMTTVFHPTRILKFESYTEHVADFLAEKDIKFDHDTLSQKTNTTDHDHYSQYFLPDERKVIEFTCGYDLQVFGYAY